MFLIDDILMAPIKGLVFLAKNINEQANIELYSPSRIKEELMALQLRFEMDQITEEEYDRQEAELLERLEQSSRS